MLADLEAVLEVALMPVGATTPLQRRLPIREALVAGVDAGPPDGAGLRWIRA
jgi:hypothetical protein